MNNEIKEILEIHIKANCDLLPKNQKKVLDYITNLQEENKNLKKELTIMVKDDEKNQDTIIRQAEKIDKAIKKLNSLIPICIMPNNMLIHGTEKAKIIEETLDILQGSELDL